jgi:DNA (cytosine-5)-methyltransferase 1
MTACLIQRYMVAKATEESTMLSSLEMCAGAGGQALGLEQAGFGHEGLVEIDHHCCATLRANRPKWAVFEEDLRIFKDRAGDFKGVELVAGGLPCPPFSVAGKQLGPKDERNLFPDALDIIEAIRPEAVMIENVRGFLSAVFQDYREGLKNQLKALGYTTDWRLLNASDYGVPQLRPRVIIVAIKSSKSELFDWPEPLAHNPLSVGKVLHDLMAADGWPGAKAWRERADEIAPTLVGGSKKHGGPDLGPTRAKQAWASLGVNGMSLADAPPPPDFVGVPRLTVPMVARLQGFPDSWEFVGRKTAAYRQVGNAFPPPVAKAVAERVALALTTRNSVKKRA